MKHTLTKKTIQISLSLSHSLTNSLSKVFYKMPNLTVFFFFLFQFFLLFLVDADFNSEFDMVWGGDRTKVTENGGLLQLSLDKSSGSGFQSKNEYLFGKIDMQIKLVPGDSAGTVTAYYLTSPWPSQDEIDFEFLGNSSGEPYILHTNVYTQGKGDREQQFYLWFDPRQNFHTYSILWNHQQILFSVDGTPIRVFRNAEGLGVPYPKNKAMRLHSTLWCADDWATRGGLVKTDWTHAPFTASYRGFKADTSKGTWWNQALDANDAKKLKWVQSNYMIYNYCTDHKRFPQGFPPECSLTP